MASASADLSVATTPPTRTLALPAKREAPRTRLGMRVTFAALQLDSSPALGRALPPGYRVVGFGEADGASAAGWARVIHAAGERPSEAAASAQFALEFAPHTATHLPQRMLFLLDSAGEPVGTATAWFYAAGRTADDCGVGAGGGRVHWVSTVPAVQGRGLAKPVMGALLRRMRELHPDGCALVTHCQAARAIGMYLEIGFRPAPLDGARFTAEERDGWAGLRELGLPTGSLEDGASGSSK
jgi:GNAT superfamily N-acetyltransferase